MSRHIHRLFPADGGRGPGRRLRRLVRVGRRDAISSYKHSASTYIPAYAGAYIR